MTETVFIKAWNNLPKFGKKEKGFNFRAWLFRIAHNLLVDFYRKQKKEDHLEEFYQKPDKSASLLSMLEKMEEKQQLQKAMKSLDERSQRVLISRFVIGMSHKDTSQSLGLTENNVRLIQFRALKKLRKILESDYE